MKLNKALKKIDTYPLHMPGHKRNSEVNIFGSSIDITEIDGYDNLHNANGIIKECENSLSSLYSSKRSFMLVNGSTCGILASIFALTNEYDTVLMARNCHKSVYNAAYLRKLNVVYLEDDYNEEFGINGRITQAEINLKTSLYKDAKAVIITSPTYEGVVSNIKTNIPLIIDSAHGAHFPFGNDFPNYPNADIVVSSLHKTLPALTQSAVLNVYNEKYINEVKKYIDIFETSSPSYILMNSIAECIDYIESNKNAFNDFTKSLKLLYNKYPLKHLKYIITDDISRINISTINANINGNDLAEILRKQCKFEVEMASLNHIIAITTPLDDMKEIEKFFSSLLEIDNTLSFQKKEIVKPVLPEKILNTYEVKEKNKTEFKNSVEKISAEYVYAYPPGIPIICPGEKISKAVLDNIENMLKNGINIISNSNLLWHFILTN